MSAKSNLNGQTVSTVAARIPPIKLLSSGRVIMHTERDFYDALFHGNEEAAFRVRDCLCLAESLLMREMSAIKRGDNGLLEVADEAYFLRLMDSYTTLAFILNLMCMLRGVGLVAEGVHHD